MFVSYYHVTYEFKVNPHSYNVCILLSRHIRVQSESTLDSLPECQGTPCSKQAPYLKFKWSLRASLAKWLSVRLRSKWLWVRIPLLSLSQRFWHSTVSIITVWSKVRISGPRIDFSFQRIILSNFCEIRKLKLSFC